MILWDETIDALLKNGKTWDDVISVQSADYRISKKKFEEIAKNTDYHVGYGVQEIATDLIIIGDGWWIRRGEHNGSEWWEFCKTPKIIEYDQTAMNMECKITSFVGCYDTLAEIVKDQKRTCYEEI
jgi:hypothetical protein